MGLNCYYVVDVNWWSWLRHTVTGEIKRARAGMLVRAETANKARYVISQENDIPYIQTRAYHVPQFDNLTTEQYRARLRAEGSWQPVERGDYGAWF